MPPQLRLLGSISILVEGGWQHLQPHNTTRLLAFLAFEGDWVLRQRLAFLFWPDSDESDARRNLRQLLKRVRQLPWLVEAPDTTLEFDKQRVRWSAAATYLDVGDLNAAAEHYRCLTLESNDLALLLGAWGRLVDLEMRLGDETAGALAIEKCLELLPRVEALPQRARGLISVIRYGSPEQLAAVGPILGALDEGSLPDYLRSELQGSLSDRGVTLA